jgi:hypothetical protein
LPRFINFCDSAEGFLYFWTQGSCLFWPGALEWYTLVVCFSAGSSWACGSPYQQESISIDDHASLAVVGVHTDKKEIKFSLYIGKFRVEQLQSHIYEEGLPII